MATPHLHHTKTHTHTHSARTKHAIAPPLHRLLPRAHSDPHAPSPAAPPLPAPAAPPPPGLTQGPCLQAPAAAEAEAAAPPGAPAPGPVGRQTVSAGGAGTSPAGCGTQYTVHSKEQSSEGTYIVLRMTQTCCTAEMGGGGMRCGHTSCPHTPSSCRGHLCQSPQGSLHIIPQLLRMATVSAGRHKAEHSEHLVCSSTSHTYTPSFPASEHVHAPQHLPLQVWTALTPSCWTQMRKWLAGATTRRARRCRACPQVAAAPAAALARPATSG